MHAPAFVRASHGARELRLESGVPGSTRTIRRVKMMHIHISLSELAALSLIGCVGVIFHATAQDTNGTAGAGDKPYRVVDGFKVDANTMNGFRAWRAAACDRCHGANQQGLVGPSLLESFKLLSREEFVKAVTEGRLEKGMPSFKTSPMVMQNTDGLYAYLKGRSNGDITRSKVEELK
jgi:mono/diheme cytochrome c family protein